MQNKVWVSLLISGCLLTACSERIRQNNVPSVVQNSLMQSFRSANNIDWEKERQNYEAEFVQDSMEYKAIINPAGSMVKYKQEISMTLLPTAVMQTLQTQYKEYRIEEVEKVGEGNQVYYQVELEKGLKEMQLVLTPEGAINTNIAYWD